MQPAGSREAFRFGDFELDVAAYALRRFGRPVKLGRQPMDLLILLVEGRGQLVSRSDIVDHLWGKDVFVDVETGVNTVISKIRQILRDSADAPAFVETVPGKGYRFIADVETVTTSTDHVVRGPVAPPAPKAGNDLRTAPSVDGPATVTAEASSPPQEGLAYAALASPRGTSGHVRLAVGLVVVAAIFGVLARTRLGGGGSATGVAVAVLPFVNLGSDTEHDYVAAGLTDETSASLAQIDPEHLSVKGRTLPYKGTTKTAAEIGQELVVDYLVESSVQAEGDRLRVTVTLIRARDQAHVWSQSYERQPSSLLGLQQELSAAIAEQIRFRLSPDRATGLGRRQTRNAEAYDAYLRGRYQARRRNPDGNARAIELYKRAIAIDQNYALAWSDLAFVYAGSAINGDARPSEVAPLARAAALEAVRANPNLSEAQFSRGYELWLLDWDWPAAEAALRLAVALDPSNAVAYRTLGHALSQSGRRDDAEAAMRAARDLDPQDAMNRALSAQVAYQNRDFRGALGHARMAVSLDSSSWIGYVELAQAYAGNGDNDLALEAVRDADRYFPGGNSKSLSLRGYLLARTGHAADAREVLRTLAARSREQYVPPSAMALVYAGLGEKDAMFEFLEKAYAESDVHLMYLPVDARWDPYRTDARFVDLLARCAFTTGR